MALFQTTGKQKIIDLGTNTTFNCTNISGYKNLTADNFYVTSFYYRNAGWRDESVNNDRDNGVEEYSLHKSYNASTGVLTCYVTIYSRYTDSNGNGARNRNLQLPCSVVCIK